MGASAALHAIVLCTRCRDPRSGAPTAGALLSEFRKFGPPEGFVVETVDCMAGCDRPLTIAFRASGKATYLFGGINAACDAAALGAFAALYRSLPDGWCNESGRPPGLRGKTLARVPASPAMQP